MIHFEFFDHSNPYIAKTPEEAFRLFCKYDFIQAAAGMYKLTGKKIPARTYREKQETARELAIEFQNSFSDGCIYFWSDLSEYQDFFETIGRKYGLIREYRENGII